MSDIQNFIGKSSTEAERKKKYREKIAQEKKLIVQEKMGQMSGRVSDKRTPEIKIELETD